MSSSKSIDGSCGATFPADSDNLPVAVVAVEVEILALAGIALELAVDKLAVVVLAADNHLAVVVVLLAADLEENEQTLTWHLE
tara:strand:- start:9 stop:257 length:249 start_codon:yes stop_codon:yes gene_type:complete